MMRYCPVPSVTAARVFSISAGLAASTVTPGSTAPDASRTVPVRDACANTVAGMRMTARAARHFVRVRIERCPPVGANRPVLHAARTILHAGPDDTDRL